MNTTLKALFKTSDVGNEWSIEVFIYDVVALWDIAGCFSFWPGMNKTNRGAMNNFMNIWFMNMIPRLLRKSCRTMTGLGGMHGRRTHLIDSFWNKRTRHTHHINATPTCSTTWKIKGLIVLEVMREEKVKYKTNLSNKSDSDLQYTQPEEKWFTNF